MTVAPAGPTTRLTFTARSVTGSGTQYSDVRDHGLEVVVAPCISQDAPPPVPGTTALRLTVRNTGPDWRGVVRADLLGLPLPPQVHPPGPADEPRFCLPAFLVGRNGGDGPTEVVREFPRLRFGGPTRPASPWWMVRADRLSHPVAAAFSGGRVVGLSASPYLVRDDDEVQGWSPGRAGAFEQFCGFTCSLDEGSVGYTLGSENAPWLFVTSALVHERADLDAGAITLRSGTSVTVDLQVWDAPAQGPEVFDAVTQAAYERFHTPPRRGSSPRGAVQDLAGAVRDAAWRPEHPGYAGFVFDHPDGSRSDRLLPSLTWTNGLAVATPMLLAGLRLGDEEMRSQALTVIEEVVEKSLNPASGLLFDSVRDGVWGIGGWWFDLLPVRGHSGYLVGQALYYLLEAYEFELRLAGVERTGWLDLVGRVLERTEASRNGDGEYPYVLSERTGAGLSYDSLGGSWCLAAAAYHAVLTGRPDRTEALLRSEAHYHRAFVARRECTGGPLDVANAPDSEGIIAYLKAVRRLHELTGDDELLDHMHDGLGYEFSFRFGWNPPVQVPPLSDMGWSACGGTVTSVANPHVHPMGSVLVDEMLHYTRHRDSAYVESRLRDTVDWGCQTYNSVPGELGFGDVGWMSERFCHSEGLLTQTYPDGSPASTWFALMPWASSCVVRGMVGDLWDSPLGEQPARDARG